MDVGDDPSWAMLTLDLRDAEQRALSRLAATLRTWTDDAESHALLIRGVWTGARTALALANEGSGLAALPRPTKPIVALIEGDCTDLGLVLLGRLSHIRVASTAARFGFPELMDGVVGGAALSGLADQVAHLPFRRLALTGSLATADEALRGGLLTAVATPDDAAATAERWAGRMAGLAPLAISSEIAAIRHTQGQAHEAARAFRFGHTNISMFDPDAIEGPLAFEQKRAPRYRGARFLRGADA